MAMGRDVLKPNTNAQIVLLSIPMSSTGLRPTWSEIVLQEGGEGRGVAATRGAQFIHGNSRGNIVLVVIYHSDTSPHGTAMEQDR